VIEDAASGVEAMVRPGSELARPLQRAARDLMWETCGVVRDDAGLRRGLEGIRELAGRAIDVDVSPSEEGWGDLGNLLDLRSALASAEATLLSALARRESRGAHNRADFPTSLDSQRVNHRVRRDAASGQLSLANDPVPPTGRELSAWLADGDVAVGGDRLLE
jgi:succinate dehydrogenase / fumarate reductase flavoprotein subunit